MTKLKWKIVAWNRLESDPRQFFIRKSTSKGQRRIRLFEYDNTPNGYHSVAYCCGLRQAKKIADDIVEASNKVREELSQCRRGKHGVWLADHCYFCESEGAA